MNTEPHGPKTPIEILQAALKKEKDAYHYYDTLLNSTSVVFLQELLEQLRDEEHKHMLLIERKINKLTAVVEREGNGYVSLCPELDIASQGDSIEEARNNLLEAVELFFETAPAEEIQERYLKEVYVTQLEVAVG